MRALLLSIGLLLVGQASAHIDSMKVYLPFYASTLDWSGWNNTAQNKGAVLSSDRNGAPDKAYYFDGNAYMQIPTKNIFTPEYSYAFWVNLDTVPEGEMTALRIAGDSCEQSVSFYRDSAGTVGLRYYTDQASSSRDIRLPGKVPVKQWTHISVLNSPDSLEVYVNLVKVYGEELKDKPCFGKQPGEAYFGSYDSLNGFVKGSLDELRIYTESIPGSELFDAYIQEKLSLNETRGQSARIFPNPLRKGEVIQLKSELAIHELQVIDIMGKVLLKQSGEDIQQLRMDFSPGTYWIRMKSTSGSINRKVLVN